MPARGQAVSGPGNWACWKADSRFPLYQAMTADPARGGLVPGREVRRMNQTVRFQEILRKLAIIDEGFVEDQAGLGLGLPAARPRAGIEPAVDRGRMGQGACVSAASDCCSSTTPEP